MAQIIMRFTLKLQHCYATSEAIVTTGSFIWENLHSLILVESFSTALCTVLDWR